MSGNKFFKLTILSVVYVLLGSALVHGMVWIEERFSKEMALIVGLPLTLLLVAFFFIMFAEILSGE